MKKTSQRSRVLLLCSIFIFIVPQSFSQTKKIKRPKNKVGITSVDNFVGKTFNLYDKVYKYDGYAAAGTPLEDEDLDVLEEALDEMTVLSENAPDLLGDIEDASFIKQGKATLQMNKAKKALSYSIKTAKALLLGERERERDADGSQSPNENTSQGENTNDNTTDTKDIESNANNSDDLEIISKFDFVPGDKLIFYDDFSQDFIGDFPSKWNTNGSGEVVKTNDEGNWFQFKPGFGIQFLPLIDSKLPEEYTIEFDLLTHGLGKNTSSTARLYVTLDDNNGFKKGPKNVHVTLPLGQYGAFNIQVQNSDTSVQNINAAINADVRLAMVNTPHISISVNEKRFRMWINQIKYVDIPQFIFDPSAIGYLKFNLTGVKDGEESIFIRNLKVAEGGVDLRRKLISEGKISTNGILFDSGSAQIQPQSYGIIRQISQVLNQDESIKLNIIGHTDADGNDNSNLLLSKARAEAVKTALIEVYKISGDRLQTDGKGESEPIENNSTAEGKAQNRRVEFIKT